MFRITLAGLLSLGLLTQSGEAAPIQLIEGLPSSYAPGQPVVFNVRLPEISNLGSYNVDLLLESNIGTAGVDFFFDATATVPASSNYVFPTTSNFFDALNVDSTIRHRVTLTDFDLSGVNVAAGSNDRVASVVFRTSSTFDGPLSVRVDAPLLILDTPDVEPTPVMGFDALQADIGAATPIQLNRVPEPPTAFLAIAAIFATMPWRRTPY